MKGGTPETHRPQPAPPAGPARYAAPWGRCGVEGSDTPLPQPQVRGKTRLYCSKRCRDRAASLMAQARLKTARKDLGGPTGPPRACDGCGRPFAVTPERRPLCVHWWRNADADTTRDWAGL